MISCTDHKTKGKLREKKKIDDDCFVACHSPLWHLPLSGQDLLQTRHWEERTAALGSSSDPGGCPGMRRARSVAHRLQPGSLTALCRMAPASRLAIQPAKTSASRLSLAPTARPQARLRGAGRRVTYARRRAVQGSPPGVVVSSVYPPTARRSKELKYKTIKYCGFVLFIFFLILMFL